MTRAAIVLSLSIALITAAFWYTNQPTSAGQPLYGDASCDETVNSVDAAVVLQFSAGLLPSLGCPDNADVNGDGQANSLDSALVLQFSAGLISYLGPISNETPIPLTPTRTPTPPPGESCPDGYYWNPAKGHCDSRECPPGLVFDEVTLYCVLPTTTPAPTATAELDAGPAPRNLLQPSLLVAQHRH